MSTEHTASTCIGFRRFQRHVACSLLAGALLILGGPGWPGAIAATQGETAVANSLPPHEKLGAGQDSVKVRWVRRRGYVDGANGHEAMLDELKAGVQGCIQAAQLAGRQTRPPQVWPDHVQSTQSDTYEAANRTITYANTLVYTYDHANCSLVENRQASAKLASARGSCNIDFENKTAHGVCDTRAHADAPPLSFPRPPASGGGTAAGNAQMRAAMAAMNAAMKQFVPARTGERKTIAGLECEVVKHVLGTDGTACITRGGPVLPGSDLELELSAVGGLNTRAVKARLEMSVDAAVFAPYFAAGFQVSDVGKRK